MLLPKKVNSVKSIGLSVHAEVKVCDTKEHAAAGEKSTTLSSAVFTTDVLSSIQHLE